MLYNYMKPIEFINKSEVEYQKCNSYWYFSPKITLKKSVCSGYCCTNVEIKFKIKSHAYMLWSNLYGNYTLSHMINGRTYYISDFDGGKYGIWWCAKFKKWYIGPSSDEGQCIGNVTSREVGQCVHNIKNWEYHDPSIGKMFKAGEGLTVACLNSGKQTSKYK